MGIPTIMPVWFGGVTGISNVADLSAVDAVIGIIMPPAWTPAAVTVEGSANGVDFYPMYEGRDAAIMSFKVPPGAIIAVNPNHLRCCKAIRLISGIPGEPIPQGEPREFMLIVEMI